MPSRFRFLLPAFAGISAGLHADVITDWNQLMLQTFAQQGQTATPPNNSRTLGMAHAAMFDAVNSISGSYQSYLGNYSVSGAASQEAAASQAARDVLAAVFGVSLPFGANFDNLLATHLAGISDGPEKVNGIAVGQAAVMGMVNARFSDGSSSVTTYAPQALNTPGAWQPGNTAGGWRAASGVFIKSEWGNVTPFGMTAGNQFRPAAPRALNSAAYMAAYNQVKEYGSLTSSTRTANQTYVAYFWMDGSGLASPPGHWDRIAQTIDASQGLTLEQNARLFALLNVTEADVAIATLEAKRAYDLWRPMPAIAQGDIDGNPDTIADAGWTPLIPSPPAPAFISGHSAFSMAAATILANFVGSDDFAFEVDHESPFVDPNYLHAFSRFNEAAEEAGMSRIYGGIHWEFDNTAGAVLGTDVANYMFSNFMVPAHEPGGLVLLAVAPLSFGHRRRR